MNIIKYINSFVPLSAEAEEYISQKIRKEILPKNALLLRADEVCEKIYFIEKGFVRWFYCNEKGKEITHSFAAENSFVTAFDSFFQRQPSRYFIEVLEDSVLYSMTYKDVEKELEQFPETQRLTQLVLIQIVEQTLDKNAALQCRTAKERYRYLTEKHPEILQRASLFHIASYLGITAETLSRIRRNAIS